MIPHQLTLKNFLSYRDVTVDFRGLHVACICGPNGAGKSSLLEAIAWAIWGQSRVTNEEDIIHGGTTEARVDLVFHHCQQTYRIIRTRHRQQSGSLEFQVETPEGFRSVTARGMRATQQLIQQTLKLDYETFVSSAYLRQGQADDFMLKRPSERKQILADLLKLDQYDQLAEQSKEEARQLTAQATVLEQQLQVTTDRLQTESQVLQERQELEGQLAAIQQQQQADVQALQILREQLQQHQNWQQQLQLQQQQQQYLQQDCQRLQQALVNAQEHNAELTTRLNQQVEIEAGYAEFQALQAEEEIQVNKFQAHQSAQSRCQELQQQLTQQSSELKTQLHQIQTQLGLSEQQEQENQRILRKAEEVKASLDKLIQEKARLQALDNLQLKAFPLMEQQRQIQAQLEREQMRLVAHLEELQSSGQQLQTQQSSQPQLQQAVIEVGDRITHLEQRRVYQQQLREKGLERRRFMDRLQDRQRECETQLAQLDQRRQLLNQSQACCPLCDRPLEAHTLEQVLHQHQAEEEKHLNQIWVIREQLAVSEREIQVLREEYRALEVELEQYGPILEHRGRLQEQLQNRALTQQQLQQLEEKKAQLERTLQEKTYANDLQSELALLNQTLSKLNYDERDHALARGQVDRLRWVESRHSEIMQAQRNQGQIRTRRQQLEQQAEQLQQRLEVLESSPLHQEIADLETQCSAIGYHLEQHQALREDLRAAQIWPPKYDALQQSIVQAPQVQAKIHALGQDLDARTRALHVGTEQIEQLTQQLSQVPDPTEGIQSLEQQIAAQQPQRDQLIAQLGQLQQQQQHLESLKQESTKQTQQLQTIQHHARVYRELVKAFGKRGIQSLMIETVLPQLEAETNHILARLSANQLHVQFVTQRVSRGSKASAKLIDTLDILISDTRGTRAYETYSGGESFRVNFAIRLALAKLLAQRSGTALQMLIVDEGFGTQDQEGCDRLITAINAIAADFACILIVTHMPHFREAFQTRIEVRKTETGSTVSLLG